jgi:DNA-binding CsgD family transcriptional regulator
MTDDLIDRIYESAFMPEQWPGVLEDLSRISDAAGGSLYISGSDFSLFTASPSARERAEQAVMGGLAHQGLALPRLLASPHAGFLTENDMMSAAELTREPLRQFWGRFGLGCVIATSFRLPTNEALVLLLSRSLERGTADRNIVDQLDALRPHLGRAFIMAARLQLERARMASDTLAALGLPALVFSETGKVLAANTLIEKLEAFICWRSQDRVALTDAVANQMLGDAIQTINLSGKGVVRSFPVRAAAAKSAMMAHVLPVRLSARDVFIRCSAVLILTPATARDAPPSEIIQSLFDLTPSEARVARGLASGMTIDGIASQSSVSRNTVRAQVRAVLEKTGCKRQAEVVGLLSGIYPLRGVPFSS